MSETKKYANVYFCLVEGRYRRVMLLTGFFSIYTHKKGDEEEEKDRER